MSNQKVKSCLQYHKITFTHMLSGFHIMIAHPAIRFCLNTSSIFGTRVMVVGSSGVGKSSLVHHFLSPDYVYTYESNRASVPEPSVCIMLEDRETELVFLDVNSEEAQVSNRLLMEFWQSHEFREVDGGCGIVFDTA